MTRSCLLVTLLLTGIVSGQLNTKVSPNSGEVLENVTEGIREVPDRRSAVSSLEVTSKRTDEGEVESLNREQPSRYRKFLHRSVKIPSGEISQEVSSAQLTGLNRNLDDSKGVPGRLSDVTAEDILPLLPRNLSSLVPILRQLSGEKCQRHAEYFLQGLHNLTKWAVQMFDAGTKIPEGILFGSNYHFGNFDECVDIRAEVPVAGQDEKEILRGQYCLATVVLSGLRQEQVQADPVDFTDTAWDSLKVPQSRGLHRKDVIHWSFCLPAACSAEEVEQFLTYAIDLSSLKGLQLDFEVAPNMCQVQREIEIDGYDIALGVVVSTFLVLVIVATIFDIFVLNSSTAKTIHGNLLLCFSAYSNISKLGKYTPSPYNLDCIFGIKAITMALILMGHASAFLMGGPSMNSNFKEEAILKVENAILLNNPLLVDTFLMIGAFLLCRILLVELDKRKFINPLIIYIARFIRLTPVYAIVIAIYCTWFYKLGSGPLWEAKIGLERDRCRTSWWANILYINNYVNSDHLCMFQSWYLAVDSQFFFLAPAIIYPLWRWQGVGEIVLVVTTLISIAIPFAVTYVNQLDPVLMMYAQEISDLSSNTMYQSSYIKTHMRGMSYMIGLLLGYIVYRLQSSKTKVPKSVVWCGWIISTFTALSAMFTVAIFYRRPYDAFEAASYAALHRVGWCLGVAWVIFACVTNNAGKIDNFLKWRPWVVFSRLSYCSYLVNGLVELHTIGSLRHTRNLTNLDIAKDTISHAILTYSIALFFSVAFEAPILSIESILLKKASRRDIEEEKTSNGSLSTESIQTCNTSESSNP